MKYEICNECNTKMYEGYLIGADTGGETYFVVINAYIKTIQKKSMKNAL